MMDKDLDWDDYLLDLKNDRIEFLEDLVKTLYPYARHDVDCRSTDLSNTSCGCGLKQILWRVDGAQIEDSSQ